MKKYILLLCLMLVSCEVIKPTPMIIFKYDFREWVRSNDHMEDTLLIYYNLDKFQFFTDTITFKNYCIFDTIFDNLSFWDSSEYTRKFAWVSDYNEYCTVTAEVYLGKVITIQRYYSGELNGVFPLITESTIPLTRYELERERQGAFALGDQEAFENHFMYIVENR